MREDERDRVSRQGTEAWRRLKRDKNWNDWIKVGEALQVGRERAMNQAMTNRPEGKAYNMAFGEWLRQYKLDDMDKGERFRMAVRCDGAASGADISFRCLGYEPARCGRAFLRGTTTSWLR
jgi:hypothetical protein